MKNKKIKELINLYRSGKLDAAEQEAKKQIDDNPNNSILFNIFGAILARKVGEISIKKN